MTAKKKPASASPEKRADITVEQQASKSRGETLARLAGNETFRAAVTERQFIGTAMDGHDLNLFDVNSVLTERFLKVTKDGDMTTLEAMLLAQAHTCEAIFHEFARRSIRSDIMPKLEAYMRMALTAQRQSASTLRILGELKSPRPVAFVKQANIANGPQQVINRSSPLTVPHAHEKNFNQSSELLEHHHGERVDIGAAGEAGREHQTVETLAEVNRADK